MTGRRCPEICPAGRRVKSPWGNLTGVLLLLLIRLIQRDIGHAVLVIGAKTFRRIVGYRYTIADTRPTFGIAVGLEIHYELLLLSVDATRGRGTGRRGLTRLRQNPVNIFQALNMVGRIRGTFGVTLGIILLLQGKLLHQRR